MIPLDPTDVLKSVITRAGQLLGAPHGYIALVTPDEQTLAFKVGVGLFGDVEDGGLGPAGEVAVHVWRSGQPLVVPSDGGRWQALPADSRISAMAAVPLKFGPRVVGVVGMAYGPESSRSFGRAEVELLIAIAQIASVALDHARLHAEERRSRELAERLQASAQVINQSLDLDVVLPAIMDRLREVIDYDSSTIQLLEGEAMRVIAARGLPPSELGRVRPLADYPYNRRLASSPEPVIEGDVSASGLWAEEPHLAAVRSHIGVPLVMRDRIIGALTVDSHQPNRYTAEDARTVVAFARHAAIAIEHARLFAAERTSREQAERLRAATQALTSTMDLQQVFALLLSELRKVVPYDSASVQELRGQRLEMIGGYGFPNLQELLGVSFDLMVGDNPNREVMRTRAAVILDDAPLLYPKFGTGPHAKVGVRSWLGVPLLFGDRLIGMLTLDKKEPGFYTPEHAALALSFAAQAAIAIEHARLYNSAQRELAERKEAQQRIDYLANFDAVTGLPNRTLLHDRLRQALAHARRELKLVAILFLDLDRFKYINDTLGHAAGDQLLKAVAERLKQTVREGDTVARLGGDEFSVVLPNLERAQDSTLVAEKIRALFTRPFLIDGREIYISASIGVTLYPLDGVDLEELLKNADAAMYRAKEQGRNTHRFFTADIMQAVERLDIESEMRHAVSRREFLLHYQPQVDLELGRLVGAEALLRWQHPKRGLVPPADFVSLAEETGLIVAIGAWALREACRQGREWQAAGASSLRISVNISGRQFSRNLVQTVKGALEESGLDPGWLELEITESILMQNPESAGAAMRELNALGIAFAVDDFGVGYSSLSHLKRFPIGTVKIDRSFVRGIPSDPNDAPIVTAIIAMAHGLGARVVAEGVEKEEQRSFLKQRGCDAIQGNLVGLPMPAAELETSFPTIRAQDASG